MLLNKKQGLGILSEMIVDNLNKKLHSDWTISPLFEDGIGVYIIEFHFKGKEKTKEEILFKLSFGISERTFHLNPVFLNLFPEIAESILNLFNALNFNLRTLTL